MSIRHDQHPVLLHGFGGSSASWGADVVEGLAGSRLAPVLVDLPGHGRHSGGDNASSFSLSAALALVSEAGAWPAPLVGYSMGARIALHFALAHPDKVRRLVLESGSPGLVTEAERAERRARDAALADSIVEEGMEVFVDRWEAQPLFETRQRLPAETRRLHRALRLQNHPRSLAAALTGLGTGSLPSLWERLPEVRTPTLLVVGALDPKYVDVAERMAGAMPNARVAVVPEAGHTVHLERPSAWVEVVTSFLLATAR